MAGLGYKTFSPGEKLTATNLQGYAVDQSVMVFASAAARTSALASPSEGMFSYLTDVDELTLYNGTAWKPVLSSTGSVLQVVTATYSTETSSATGAFVTTGLNATITPSATSSKVMVHWSTPIKVGVGASYAGAFTVFRGTAAGTNLGSGATAAFAQFFGVNNIQAVFSGSVLDSPATTSAQTYTVGMSSTSASNTVYAQANGMKGTLTLMEIAG